MGLNFFAVGPIVPLVMDDLGINNSAASLLTGLPFFVHIVFAIPASMLVGRVGLKKLIALGTLVNATPLLTFVAVDSFPLLLALRALFGCGLILFFLALGPMLMQWFQARELPLVNGIFIIATNVGISTSAFVVIPLSKVIRWEGSLSVFGAVALLAAACWLAFGRARIGLRPTESHPSIERVWRVLRSRNTLLVGAADAGPLALLTVANAWLPTFYQQHGMSLAKAGALMGLFSLSGVAALVLASLLTVRVHRRKPFLILPGILVGFAGIGTFLLAGSIGVYFAIVALGFACWFYVPALVTIPMELHQKDPQQVSVVFATLLMVGGVAGFLAPLTVGAITDAMGSFLPGFALFAVLAWSLAIAGYMLPETGIPANEEPRTED
jgi:CP family cyanate transporter-like MFS transporter